MVKETDIVFSLLRGVLTGEEPKVREMDAQRWWSLFRLLQRNHVAALCFDSAAALLPRDVKMPWLAEREKAAEWHRYQQTVQDDLVERMRSHGIDTLVLKGTHTARHYPKPELREFGDLDLYFYDRHDEADEVARQELGATIATDSHHHTKYNYRGITVESHYDFLNTHYPPSNKRYEAILKELSTLDSQRSTFEVLFLLRHMGCHFAASRITLRDLVDWTLTCRALHDKADWDLVRQTMHDSGMEPFASALDTIAERQLGLTLPFAPTGISDADERLERDIIYGTVDDCTADGLRRLRWKATRWRSLAWKRRMVYSDSGAALLLASLTSHAEKPRSILHKQ